MNPSNIYTPIEQHLQEIVAEALHDLYAVETAAASIGIQPTKKEFKGHYTLVVFPFLKQSKSSPEKTAQAIGEWIQTKKEGIVRDFNVVKGFLNMELADAFFIAQLVKASRVEHFGTVDVTPESPLYMVEYSSPNTNKPLHLGHVRNNLLGYSLARILQGAGYRVIKTNIVNDRGIHICKSMLAWKRWGEGITPKEAGKKGDHLVGDFYVLFDKHYRAEVAELCDKGLTKEQAEAQSSLMHEAHELLKLWEAGDEETLQLWRMMNSWVYEGFDETYKRMGVDFDKIYYESQTYLEGKSEVLRGLKEGIFVQDPDGSVWADLRNEGYDRKILLRADGTSVYITQDIGTAKMRFKDFAIDRMVYVVGNEQDYHFQVLSIILDKLGFGFGKDLKHFSYGMVELPNGKMKSREGTVVDADDLIETMIEDALKVSTELGKMKDIPDDERAEIARIVGLGALKYFLLKVDPKKNMMFDPEESIDFNGNTGPFIQYTYARIQSVLRKAKETELSLDCDAIALVELSEKETALVVRLNQFPDTVVQAAENMNPASIANYCYDLVREFNQFYHDHSILGEEDKAKQTFRLLLSRMTGDVIRTGVGLLGIEVPERM